ncbi:hypothetical protein PNQ92_06675 [Halobacterium salinarum]|uniref:hypothetical protein n=1 Tax=Halobacterium salinarum TaxID=2242 RepID=UPI0025542BEE|nr:hypothetical protein [Halobacterium salinarum]MDL0125094.1 hypothetical protein [Halobacterium salinarum]
MPGVPNTHHAARIAATQLRIGWRKLRGKSVTHHFAVGLAVVAVTAMTPGITWVVYANAQSVVDGASAIGTLVPAGIGVVTVVMTAYLTVLQIGDIDVRDGYLTTVPARDVVGGLLAAGYVRVAGMFVPPLIVASVGLAGGVGRPLALLSAPIAVLALTTTAYLVGFPIGMVIAYALGQSAFVDRYKGALGAGAFIAYLALLLTDSLWTVAGPVIEAARASPVAWYTDLALITVPGADASALRAGAALAGSVGVAALGVLASVRVSERRWYDDGAHADVRTTDSARSGRLDGVLGRPAAWVARKSWLRARRAPIKLLYVVYPVFVLFGPIQNSIAAGRVTATLPATLTLYAAWATGALFALNPLGDEGAVLPVTATSGVAGRDVVAGLVAASALVGTPVSIAVAVVLGVLSPLSPVAVACLAVGGVVLPALAATVAAGVGASFPKYEATSMTRSREVVVPSLWSFGVYTIVFLLSAGIATGAQSPAVGSVLGGALGVSTAVVHVAGLAVGLAVAGACAVVAGRNAVRAFDGYTADG